MNSRAAQLALAVAATIAAARLASAADVPVEARIDEVKVYQQGASITRRSQATIPSGTHRLIFKDLPANIDTDTLRIVVGSREVQLGGIEVERITDKEYVSAQERELRDRLQMLADRRGAIEDEIATAETQLKLLDSLASIPSGGVSKPAVDAATLSSVLTTMSTSASSARAKVREAKLRQRDIDKDIAKTNADLQKIATARKQSYEVRAFIEAATAVAPAVSIEYATNDAQWRWVYEARLDTNAKRVTLARKASVEQRSGENWQNATLTLTTARPAENAMTPQVASLFLDLEEKPSDRLMRAVASPAPASRDLSEIVVTGSYQRADVISTEYLADYKIPGRITLDSDGEPRIYPVAHDEVPVELTARVIPSASRSAYLEALFTYGGEVPIQGGALQLYRDGAFVGAAAMQALLPGAAARIPFGADERIRVVVRDEAKDSGDKGVISKQHTDEHKQRFEVTNYHAIPIDIEIIDRVPVAQNKDVKVEILKGATGPTTSDLDGKAGIMLWRIAAQPQQTATVRHYYAVRYPAERQLSPRYGEDE
jgi:uncharacterized protein (TIGR02231 family)